MRCDSVMQSIQPSFVPPHPNDDHLRPDPEWVFLNLVRRAAMDCRTKPRADLFRACALLQVDRIASQQAHVEVLVRCLPQALGKQARTFAPGVSETTFDEAWLCQIRSALLRDDLDSVHFLIASRVTRELRRQIKFLIAHIVHGRD